MSIQIRRFNSILNHLESSNAPTPPQATRPLHPKSPDAAVCIVAERYSQPDGLGDFAFVANLFEFLKNHLPPSIELSIHPLSSWELKDAHLFELDKKFENIDKIQGQLAKVPTLIIHAPVLAHNIGFKITSPSAIWNLHEYSFLGSQHPRLQGKIYRTGLGTAEMGIFCHPFLYQTMKQLELAGKDCDPSQIEHFENIPLKSYLLGNKNAEQYGKKTHLYFGYSHSQTAMLKFYAKVLELSTCHSVDFDIVLIGNADKPSFFRQIQSFLTKEALDALGIKIVDCVQWNREFGRWDTVFSLSTQDHHAKKRLRILCLAKVAQKDIVNLFVASQKFVLVTGDDTLAKAISARKIIDYGVHLHKATLQENLVKLANRLKSPLAAKYLSCALGKVDFGPSSLRNGFVNPETEGYFPRFQNIPLQIDLLKDPKLKESFGQLADLIYSEYNLGKNLIGKIHEWHVSSQSKPKALSKQKLLMSIQGIYTVCAVFFKYLQSKLPFLYQLVKNRFFILK